MSHLTTSMTCEIGMSVLLVVVVAAASIVVVVATNTAERYLAVRIAVRIRVAVVIAIVVVVAISCIRTVVELSVLVQDAHLLEQFLVRALTVNNLF